MGIHHELMEVTVTIARSFSISPFDVMREDASDVILMINHFIEKAGEAPSPKRKNPKEERVRVTDSTASGGWY